jgi:hypothetical protein
MCEAQFCLGEILTVWRRKCTSEFCSVQTSICIFLKELPFHFFIPSARLAWNGMGCVLFKRLLCTDRVSVVQWDGTRCLCETVSLSGVRSLGAKF